VGGCCERCKLCSIVAASPRLSKHPLSQVAADALLDCACVMGTGEVKVATVESAESLDNMATLPVSQRQQATEERHNSANREAEAKGKKGKEVKITPDEPTPKR